MPRVSAFYGIVIAMYHHEHGVPHFHAIYSGDRASIAIETLEVLEGWIPRRASGWLKSGRDCTVTSCSPTGGSPASISLRSMGVVSELVSATAVEVVADHRVRVWFDDGTDGEVDFREDDFRGIFEPLRDPAYFAQVGVDEELGTIVWPNDADIAPEALHSWVTRGRDRQPA